MGTQSFHSIYLFSVLNRFPPLRHFNINEVPRSTDNKTLSHNQLVLRSLGANSSICNCQLINDRRSTMIIDHRPACVWVNAIYHANALHAVHIYFILNSIETEKFQITAITGAGDAAKTIHWETLRLLSYIQFKWSNWTIVLSISWCTSTVIIMCQNEDHLKIIFIAACSMYNFIN